MNKINIAYAPDDGYMNMTIVSMVSAIKNNPNHQIEFIILYSNLSDKSLLKLQEVENSFNCKIRMLKMEESEFDGLPMSKWVTVQAWFRIKIPDLCPDLDKVLYLDCDTLVNGSLEELFSMDLADNYVASVKDVWGVKDYVKRLQMESDTYFNSGMLLINCKKYRDEDVFNKIKEYSIKYKKIIKFCDQDTLNKIIDTKKINLPPKYNFMDTWWRNYYNEYEGEDLRNYKEAFKNPVIAHLTGPKPDVKGCKNILTQKWWEYAKMTGVYSEILDKYNNSKEPDTKIKWSKQIFSLKNEYRYKDKWKVLTLLGIKIKFRLERAEKIFVIFNTAFIGDILLNNTLAQNIKYFYPESKVVFVTQPQFRDVALYQKDVDDVVVFNKKLDSNFWGILNFVRKFPYKNIFASFAIYSNDRNLIISRLLGAKHIMTEPKGLFTKLMTTKEKFEMNEYIHKKDTSTGLIEPLVGKSILDLPIKYEPQVVDVDSLLSGEKFIAIATTSKMKLKDMPVEDCFKLINKIKFSGKIPVMLGAGEVAREYIKELHNLKCPKFIDLTDKTDFVQLANVLKKCEGLISVDTGTMHFGNALNVPTVGLFYFGFADAWAPQEGLYKSVVLTENITTNSILEAFNNLIKN